MFQVEEELRGDTGDLPDQCVVLRVREKMSFKCHLLVCLWADLPVNRESSGAWTLSNSSWVSDIYSTLVPMCLVLVLVGVVSAFEHRKTALLV